MLAIFWHQAVVRVTRVVVVAILVVVVALSIVSPTHAAHFGYRPLRRGDAGEDVEELQWMLLAFGRYKGKVDGRYGQALENAVKAMEKVYGLPETGRVNGRLLEIARTLWSVFTSSEFNLSEIDPGAVARGGRQVELRTHKVARGDTLYSIARRYGTRPATLAKMNMIASPDRIFAGQTIYVLTYK